MFQQLLVVCGHASTIATGRLNLDMEVSVVDKQGGDILITSGVNLIIIKKNR